MIERLYLRELVTFEEVDLEFSEGLVVLTGPSGAGKSVLMSAILNSFGYPTQGAATLCEVNLMKPAMMQSEAYILEDEMVVKTLKKEKLRYFLDGQNISKKALGELFSPYVRYLSVRDKGGFESATLLGMIDNLILSKDKTFKKLYKEYRKRHTLYRQKAAQLAKMKEDEAKLAELIEFAQYEIEKIATINPQMGEEEELLKVKQQLSRIDKVKAALGEAEEIFRVESSVEEVYRLLDKDVSMFTEAMNQLRADFEESEQLAETLEEINVEEVLDRLSDLTTLKNRYGSIEAAIAYKEAKEKELRGYTHITQDKSMLESFLAMEYTELQILSSQISQRRQKEAKEIERGLATYLATLKLPTLSLVFSSISLGEQGTDSVEIFLGGSKTATLSGGEYNRVRLALMAMTLPQKAGKQGVLILDEIDANVSGDESIAIAQLITELSSAYQVFAISHQPHLTANAQQHIVVTKSTTKSEAKVLDDHGRIEEIARIIAGENPTIEALEFAKKLRAS